MNRYLKSHYNGLLFLALMLLVVLNVAVTYFENETLLHLVKPLFVPVFLIFFLIKNKMLNMAFILFLIFSFIGDVFPLLLGKDVAFANGMYMLGYLGLLGIAISNLRFDNIDKVVGAYLLVVLLINGYFLVTLCSIMSTLITGDLEMILFGTKSIILMLLCFVSFAVYLGAQTKASILFLIMSISLVFSEILNYIDQYYVYNWSILMLERVLHAVAIFYAFKYIIQYNKTEEINHFEQKPKHEHENVFVGDNILV